MIQWQQSQLQALQRQYSDTEPQQPPPELATAVPTHSSSSSTHRSLELNPRPLPSPPMVPFPVAASSNTTRPRSPLPRNSLELARQTSRSSRTPSRTTSPSLRPISAGLGDRGEDSSLASSIQSQTGRDDVSFSQAESLMLTRENQMLKQRIRELGMVAHRASSNYFHSLCQDNDHWLISLKCRTSAKREFGIEYWSSHNIISDRPFSGERSWAFNGDCFDRC